MDGSNWQVRETGWLQEVEAVSPQSPRTTHITTGKDSLSRSRLPVSRFLPTDLTTCMIALQQDDQHLQQHRNESSMQTIASDREK